MDGVTQVRESTSHASVAQPPPPNQRRTSRSDLESLDREGVDPIPDPLTRRSY